MKITVLAENTPGALPGEHGLSLLVETNGRRYLIDMGQSSLFLENARALGIDLGLVDVAFLSHGHYDHGGGLEAFLNCNGSACVYCSPHAFEAHFGGKDKHGNGLDGTIPRRFANRLRFAAENTEPEAGVFLIPHRKAPSRTFDFLLDRGKGFEPDDFSHEQTVAMQTEKGLVIFSSCTHAGIDQVLEETEAALPGKPIYAVIGGFHLEDPKQKRLLYTEEEIRAQGRLLMEKGIQSVITGHCTGGAIGILKSELKDHCIAMHTGMQILL